MKPISTFDTDSYRWISGGSSIDFPHHARVANRSWYAIDTRSSYLGFRRYLEVR